MKIEVGMYVRTNEGIGTVQRIYNNKNDCTVRFKKGHVKKWVTIFKASHNIIDLIEVGDIISYEFPTGLGMLGYENVTVLPELLNTLQNGENNHEYTIKSIVTKEQFESMSYKVGE